MNGTSAPDSPDSSKYQWHRDLLALIVVIASLLGVGVLSVLGIYKG